MLAVDLVLPKPLEGLAAAQVGVDNVILQRPAQAVATTVVAPGTMGAVQTRARAARPTGRRVQRWF